MFEEKNAADIASYHAFKDAIVRTCKGQRVGGKPRSFEFEPEMTKFNGQKYFTVRRNRRFYYYVIDAVPACGCEEVYVFLTKIM